MISMVVMNLTLHFTYSVILSNECNRDARYIRIDDESMNQSEW